MLSVYIQKSLFNKVAASVYAFGPLYLHAYLQSLEGYILDTVLRPCTQRCPKELITSLFMDWRCKARCAFCLIKNTLSIT